MAGPFRIRFVRSLACPAAWALAATAAAIAPLSAQRGPGGGNPQMGTAARLDVEGKTAEARAIFQRMIDSLTDPASKASAQRAMAMSYAFAGDCAGTVRHEQMVIAYWTTREQAEPQNAFYQEGEMADEAARVCIDAGDFTAADTWYRKGYEMGTKEPAPQTHPKSLWDFRLAHALGRLAARRGDRAEAARQVAAARAALDGDPAVAKDQERFFPYLLGYVALYTDDLSKAESEFTNALALPGNQNDPFLTCLLAMTFEREGQTAKANELYRFAYEHGMGHNPPAAFVRPFVRKKLGLP
jgi:tetratricopeptide (TPR) repeat protein